MPEPAVRQAGLEAVELAESAGLILDPWQRAVLDDALGERDDRKWAAFEVALLVPRQNGKGSVLEARELAGLFLFGERLLLHSAHEFKTASEAFRRLLFLIENTPELDRQVMRVRTSHGEEGVELKSGQRIRFVARSTGSGRGFTGDTVILDEAYNLPAKAMAALMPTMSGRSVEGNPQLWYASSAPLPEESSVTLRGLCQRGRKGGANRLCYIEYSADPDSPLDDRGQWEQANPGLHVRIDPEFVQSERQAMDADTFARERLGIFPDAQDESAVPMLDWHACLTPNMRLEDPVALGVDVTPSLSWGAIAAAAPTATGDGVELIDHQRGTSWIVPRLQELVANHAVSTIIVDRVSAANSLVAAMEEAGLPVRRVDTPEHKAACGELYSAIVDHTLQHLDQPGLEAAVVGASKRDVGDAWMWNRRGGADISPLVAVTLARIGRRDRDGHGEAEFVEL